MVPAARPTLDLMRWICWMDGLQRSRSDRARSPEFIYAPNVLFVHLFVHRAVCAPFWAPRRGKGGIFAENRAKVGRFASTENIALATARRLLAEGAKVVVHASAQFVHHFVHPSLCTSSREKAPPHTINRKHLDPRYLIPPAAPRRPAPAASLFGLAGKC